MNSGRRTRLVRRRRAASGRGHRSRNILIVLALVPVVVLGLIAGVAFIGLQVAAAGATDLSRLGQLSDQQPVTEAQTSQIFASDGTTLAYLYGEQNRTVTVATPSAETSSTPSSPSRTSASTSTTAWTSRASRARWSADLKAGKIVQGASTITEQLVGNLYLNRAERLAQPEDPEEAALALQSRRPVHQGPDPRGQYLNTVYFGANAYGVQARPPDLFRQGPRTDLTLAESALLAGLPRPPPHTPAHQPG